MIKNLKLEMKRHKIEDQVTYVTNHVNNTESLINIIYVIRKG
jgi:hypothetical protein